MKTRWTLADLLDLEYLFGRDDHLRSREGEQALAKRDRVIYLARIAPKLQDTSNPAPKDLIRGWLHVRQTQAGNSETPEGELLPGIVWRELSLLLGSLALACGGLSGLVLAGAVLAYTGSAPLNVSLFLGLFVVLPLLLLAGQCFLLLLARLRRTERTARTPVLQAIVMRLVTSCADWMYTRACRTASAEQRLNFAALVGKLRSRREQARVFVWPVFTFFQLAAIGFTLGVLFLTLAKVVFSDLAFGWQSSLQPSAMQVENLVQIVALPWSWALPENWSYPSLEQVEGTKIVLKDGIRALQTKNLVSWWPFLCMSLLVYGLLPRVIMLVWGLRCYRKQLAQLDLRSPETRRLLQRMTTPQVETRGAQVDESAAKAARDALAAKTAQTAPAFRKSAPPAEALRKAVPPAAPKVQAETPQTRPASSGKAAPPTSGKRPEENRRKVESTPPPASAPLAPPAPARPQPEATVKVPEPAKPQTEAPAKAPETAKPQPEAPAKTPETVKPQPEAPAKAPETAKPQPETSAKTPEPTKPQPEAPAKTPETVKPQREALAKTPETVKPEPEAPAKAPETAKPELEALTKAPETAKPQPEAPAKTPEPVKPQPEAPAKVPEPAKPQSEAPAKTPEPVKPESEAPAKVPESVKPEPEALAKAPEPVKPEPEAPAKVPESTKPEPEALAKPPESGIWAGLFGLAAERPEKSEPVTSPEPVRPESEAVSETPEPSKAPDQVAPEAPLENRLMDFLHRAESPEQFTAQASPDEAEDSNAPLDTSLENLHKLEAAARQGQTASPEESAPLDASLEHLESLEAQAAASAGPQLVSLRRVILAPEELLDGMDCDALQTLLAGRIGPGETEVAELPFLESGEKALLARLHDEYTATQLDEVYLLQEAWTPPLQETCTLLTNLRQNTDAATPLTVLLIGKPEGKNRLTPALPEHVEIWRKKMQTLADPSLDILELVQNS